MVFRSLFTHGYKQLAMQARLHEEKAEIKRTFNPQPYAVGSGGKVVGKE